jgi:beta-aspartyl-peptidase (threonine type)
VTEEPVVPSEPVVVVHGGAAGTAELIDQAVVACEVAAGVGLAVLNDGASAVDAVEVAVRSLEDAPVLNAGTGGALTSDRTLELDACIMDGASLDAGAVAGLSAFRHPISVARAVLAAGSHVLYVGAGADGFATGAGFEPVDPQEMITDYARRHLEVGDTVGAVALDADGRLAAATSTGGMPGQTPGRVGDSAIVGAGTYARDGAAACSVTGDGEAILRATLARDVIAMIELDRELDPVVAAEAAILRLRDVGRGSGGLILLDWQGRVGVTRNTLHMSHATARPRRPIESGS